MKPLSRIYEYLFLIKLFVADLVSKRIFHVFYVYLAICENLTLQLIRICPTFTIEAEGLFLSWLRCFMNTMKNLLEYVSKRILLRSPASSSLSEFNPRSFLALSFFLVTVSAVSPLFLGPALWIAFVIFPLFLEFSLEPLSAGGLYELEDS